MAKAIAECKCSECGSTFMKTTVKRNRKEAESWVVWAEKYFTQCPECWKRAQREAPVIEVTLDEKGVLLAWRGNTARIENEIREASYAMENGRWQKRVAQEDCGNEMYRFSCLGVRVEQYVTHYDVDVYWAARQGKPIPPKPVKPSCVPNGKWNGKVYGNAIYVDNVKHVLTSDEVDAVKSYVYATDFISGSVEFV